MSLYKSPCCPPLGLRPHEGSLVPQIEVFSGKGCVNGRIGVPGLGEVRNLKATQLVSLMDTQWEDNVQSSVCPLEHGCIIPTLYFLLHSCCGSCCGSYCLPVCHLSSFPTPLLPAVRVSGTHRVAQQACFCSSSMQPPRGSVSSISHS